MTLALQYHQQLLLNDGRLADPRHEWQCRQREKEAQAIPSQFQVGQVTRLGIISHSWLNDGQWEHRLTLRNFDTFLELSEAKLLTRLEECQRVIRRKRKKQSYKPFGGFWCAGKHQKLDVLPWRYDLMVISDLINEQGRGRVEYLRDCPWEQ